MKAPIKVLMVVSSLRRAGPIVVIQNLLQNLDREKVDVQIVKLMPDEKDRSITSEFEKDGYVIHELNSNKFEVEVFPNRTKRKIEKIIQNFSPDLIHVHGYQCSQIIARIKTSVPKIETVHCIFTEDYQHYGKLLGKYMTKRHNHSIGMMDQIIAISDVVKYSCMTSNTNVYPIKIYNGVRKPTPLNRSEARTRLGLSQTAVIFVVVGALIDLKDPLSVIKSFKLAFPMNDKSDVQLFFLGKGHLKEACEAEIGYDRRIKLLGWRPDIFEWLAASDFSICASHSEGFGLSFIESIINGTPVIGSTIPAFVNFFSYFPELTEWSFPPGNIKLLSEKLKKAASTQIEMRRLKEYALSKFGAQTMAQSYLDIYESLVK